jgi:CRISPR/Cas system-associated protein Cas10 (large subunit of type III CRISPR-Cas system)
MEIAATEIVAPLHHPHQRGINGKNLIMHNPFVLLSAKLLDSLIKAGNTHFVRQTYPRGKNELHDHVRAAFLITHYTNDYRAQTHYEVLANDPHRFLYTISDPEHLKKLNMAALQPLGYKIYSPLMQEPWKPSSEMTASIRKYISEKVNWTPGRNNAVKADLFTQFGELFITLKYGNHEVKVKLEEIEKY